jgi:hypothetical protein
VGGEEIRERREEESGAGDEREWETTESGNEMGEGFRGFRGSKNGQQDR